MRRLLLFIGLVFLSSQAQADVTVLIRFDNSGHHVHRVFVTEPTSVIDAVLPRASTRNPSASFKMNVQWFDAQGRMLASTFHSDPRSTHAPTVGGQNQINPTWVQLNEGAYKVVGPESSASLRILLPERELPPIQPEIWELLLP